MQPVMQWITRSSGRTLVRSAQVEEGMRKREERRVLGGGEGRGFRFQLKGDKGGGLISRLLFISWSLAPGVGQYPSRVVSAQLLSPACP